MPRFKGPFPVSPCVPQKCGQGSELGNSAAHSTPTTSSKAIPRGFGRAGPATLAPGHYLVRLYPCCSEEKSRRGWQRANRSGTQDQMSLISFTLTISEGKFSAWTAKCTNCLGRAGRDSEHSRLSPDLGPHPRGMQSLSRELGLRESPCSRRKGTELTPGGPPQSPYKEGRVPSLGRQKHLFSKAWGQRASGLW